MRWLAALVLALALGVMPVMGCGEASPCGDCNDGNPCTIDECVYVWFYLFGSGPTGYQCRHNRSVADGTPCGSGNVCVSGSCRENLCQGVPCEDGNPCTRDLCYYHSGSCRHEPLYDEPCPHESGRGVCYRGVCGENLCVDVVCDDDNLCTEDYCDLHIGCVYEPPDCYDDDGCTQDLCDPATGLCYFTTPSDDGTGCWITGRDGVGACEAAVCIAVCDPASEQELPCPVEDYEDWLCCPGEQGCHNVLCY